MTQNAIWEWFRVLMMGKKRWVWSREVYLLNSGQIGFFIYKIVTSICHLSFQKLFAVNLDFIAFSFFWNRIFKEFSTKSPSQNHSTTKRHVIFQLTPIRFLTTFTKKKPKNLIDTSTNPFRIQFKRHQN